MIGLTFSLLRPLNGIWQGASDIGPLPNPLWVRASFPQILAYRLCRSERHSQATFAPLSRHAQGPTLFAVTFPADPISPEDRVWRLVCNVDCVRQLKKYVIHFCSIDQPYSRLVLLYDYCHFL